MSIGLFVSRSSTVCMIRRDEKAAIDTGSPSSSASIPARNRDRERKLIKKINETIARIEAAEYGYCDSCGVEIGLKRLEARPTATLCIDCKTLDELREKQVAK